MSMPMIFRSFSRDGLVHDAQNGAKLAVDPFPLTTVEAQRPIIYLSQRRKTKTFSTFSVTSAFKSLRIKKKSPVVCSDDHRRDDDLIAEVDHRRHHLGGRGEYAASATSPEVTWPRSDAPAAQHSAEAGRCATVQAPERAKKILGVGGGGKKRGGAFSILSNIDSIFFRGSSSNGSSRKTAAPAPRPDPEPGNGRMFRKSHSYHHICQNMVSPVSGSNATAHPGPPPITNSPGPLHDHYYYREGTRENVSTPFSSTNLSGSKNGDGGLAVHGAAVWDDGRRSAEPRINHWVNRKTNFCGRNVNFSHGSSAPRPEAGGGVGDVETPGSIQRGRGPVPPGTMATSASASGHPAGQFLSNVIHDPRHKLTSSPYYVRADGTATNFAYEGGIKDSGQRPPDTFDGRGRVNPYQLQTSHYGTHRLNDGTNGSVDRLAGDNFLYLTRHFGGAGTDLEGEGELSKSMFTDGLDDSSPHAGRNGGYDVPNGTYDPKDTMSFADTGIDEINVNERLQLKDLLENFVSDPATIDTPSDRIRAHELQIYHHLPVSNNVSNLTGIRTNGSLPRDEAAKGEHRSPYQPPHAHGDNGCAGPDQNCRSVAEAQQLGKYLPDEEDFGRMVCHSPANSSGHYGKITQPDPTDGGQSIVVGTGSNSSSNGHVETGPEGCGSTSCRGGCAYGPGFSRNLGERAMGSSNVDYGGLKPFAFLAPTPITIDTDRTDPWASNGDHGNNCQDQTPSNGRFSQNLTDIPDVLKTHECSKFLGHITVERTSLLSHIKSLEQHIAELEQHQDIVFQKLTQERQNIETQLKSEIANVCKEQKEILEYQNVCRDYLKSLEMQRDEKRKMFTKLQESINRDGDPDGGAAQDIYDHHNRSDDEIGRQNGTLDESHDSDARNYEELEFQILEIDSKIEEEKDRANKKIDSQKERFYEKYQYTQEKIDIIDSTRIDYINGLCVDVEKMDRLRARLFDILKMEKNKIQRLDAILLSLGKPSTINDSCFPLEVPITDNSTIDTLDPSENGSQKIADKTNRDEMLRRRASEEIKTFWKNHLYHQGENHPNQFPTNGRDGPPKALSERSRGTIDEGPVLKLQSPTPVSPLFRMNHCDMVTGSVDDNGPESRQDSSTNIDTINMNQLLYDTVNHRLKVLDSEISKFRRANQRDIHLTGHTYPPTTSHLPSIVTHVTSGSTLSTIPNHYRNGGIVVRKIDSPQSIPDHHNQSVSPLDLSSPSNRSFNSCPYHLLNPLNGTADAALANRCRTSPDIGLGTHRADKFPRNLGSDRRDPKGKPGSGLGSGVDSIHFPVPDDEKDNYGSSVPSLGKPFGDAAFYGAGTENGWYCPDLREEKLEPSSDLVDTAWRQLGARNGDAIPSPPPLPTHMAKSANGIVAQNAHSDRGDSSVNGNGPDTVSTCHFGTFDLRNYLRVSSGHDFESYDKYICVTKMGARGYLHKLGMKFKIWKKRWFIFDKIKRNIMYYDDKSETKARGIIYFQAIEEVYVDHMSSFKPPVTDASLCLKTFDKLYYLSAPTADVMRIWVDIFLTGTEGQTIYKIYDT